MPKPKEDRPELGSVERLRSSQSMELERRAAWWASLALLVDRAEQILKAEYERERS